MLITTILGTTTAISLSYFNQFLQFQTTEFWKRMLVILLVLNIFILIESNTGISFSCYSNLISLSTRDFMFLALLFISAAGVIQLPSLHVERYIFILTLVLGGTFLICSTDFLTIFIGLELQSYSVYLIAASHKNHEPSENAGLKYFLLGALSSTFILLGFIIIYVSSLSANLSYNLEMALDLSNYELILGFLLIFIGILWKLAAAPLHAWSIDVYDAVPGKITAVLSLLPKIGLFCLAVKLLEQFPQQSQISTSVVHVIIIVTILSFLIGSILGLRQSRIKRLLAYSSVLNVGFILMAAILAKNTTITVFYIIQYIMSTMVVWLCLTSMNKGEITLSSQLQGSKLISASLCLSLLILSTAGIPPMVGFFAKYEVILLAVNYQYMTLALIAIVASLLSTVYYLNIVKNIWFTQNLNSNFTSLSDSTMSNTTYQVSSFTLIIITLILVLYVIEQKVIFTYLSFINL